MFLTACSTQDDTSHLEIKSSASTFENPYLFIGRGCVKTKMTTLQSYRL